MKLLVIDDDAVARGVTRVVAGKAGYEVTEAANGARALDILEEQEFDVIVCDIRMPDMDGVSFFKQLRNSNPQQARRVIFLSGFAGESPVERFARDAAQPLVSKPLQLTAFEKALRGVLPD